MFHNTGTLLAAAVTVVFLLSPATFTSGADDLLAQAAAQFRAKDYADAIRLAQKAGDSPKRAFFLGMSLLRQGQAEEGLPLLVEAESKLPLVGDYAALYQAEALLNLKKYPEAAAKAAAIPKAYPASQLIRRSEKLYADIVYEAGDYPAALKAYQGFVEKYPSGSDSVEALFQTARCREETGDKSGSATIYRNIWMNNPAAAQSPKSLERLKELEKTGIKAVVYTPEELLRRASTLAAHNEYSSALKVLQSIPAEGRTPAVAARIELRTGLVLYRLRRWKDAEKVLAKVTDSKLPGIRSEARFWQAKALERQGLKDQAFELYMELAGEGKKQEYADDALMEAAGLRRNQGDYSEAACLFMQIVKSHPDSKFNSRAVWESGWCHYLAGEYAVATEVFKLLLKDEDMREKAIYWLARTLENTANADADSYFRILLADYPAGFYATWYRERKGLKDAREPLGQHIIAELPLVAGFDKPRLLAELGMVDESRKEMAVARKKAGGKNNLFPGLARTYLEMKDYSSAISLFLQNRPVKWETSSLALWSAGYPRVYATQVAQYTAVNELSEGLIYGLIRAESGFSPAVKSPVGAIGLMQLMPATAKAVARENGAFDSQRLVNPDFNIKLGTKHFRDLMKGYEGDVVYSIAAYNAGGSAVNRWRKGLKGLEKDEFIESIPYLETRNYVKKVYASAATYRQLYGLK